MYLTNSIYPNIRCTVIYRPKRKSTNMDTNIHNNFPLSNSFMARIVYSVLFSLLYYSTGLLISAFVTSITLKRSRIACSTCSNLIGTRLVSLFASTIKSNLTYLFCKFNLSLWTVNSGYFLHNNYV